MKYYAPGVRFVPRVYGVFEMSNQELFRLDKKTRLPLYYTTVMIRPNMYGGNFHKTSHKYTTFNIKKHQLEYPKNIIIMIQDIFGTNCTMSNVGKLDIMVNNNKKGDEARRSLLRY